MTIPAAKRRYRSTESKYKGGAHEMYVTYDLEQKTRGTQNALYHKVYRWGSHGLENGANTEENGPRSSWPSDRVRPEP